MDSEGFYWIFLSVEGDLAGKEIIIFTLLSIPLHRHQAPAKCLYLCWPLSSELDNYLNLVLIFH